MIRIRHTYGYIDDNDILKLKDFEKFDVDLNVMGRTVTRKMVEVMLPNKKDYQKEDRWYIDVVTGTMYNPKTGRGNSFNIYIEAVYK